MTVHRHGDGSWPSLAAVASGFLRVSALTISLEPTGTTSSGWLDRNDVLGMARPERRPRGGTVAWRGVRNADSGLDVSIGPTTSTD